MSMMELPSRQRPLTLLAIVIGLQVLLLAFQIKRDHEVRLVRVWAVDILTPLQRSGTWMISSVHGVWGHYIDLRRTSVENDRLHSELGRLELRNRELESRAVEADRLATLLGFHTANPNVQMVAAQVIGANADASSRTIFINRGDQDHLRKNMAVITPEGIVGKVVEVYQDTSQVLLITDRESGVGALFSGSRTHGVIKGMSEPYLLMDYVINEEKVSQGQEILTSGEDQIFPKDLLIGTVVKSKNGNPFATIDVRPAARLDRLEEVLVLLSRREAPNQKKAEPVEAPAPTSGAATPSAAAPEKPATTTATPPVAKSAPKPPATTPEQR
jgi:rod shape-determining protein MreC